MYQIFSLRTTLWTKKTMSKKQIEINPRPSAIVQNDQNQSKKQFSFNLKPCEPKGSNTQRS